jgi:hypothetical protein
MLDGITHTFLYCYQHNGMDSNEYNIHASAFSKSSLFSIKLDGVLLQINPLMPELKSLFAKLPAEIFTGDFNF